MGTQVTYKGPLFDGRADDIVRAFMSEATEAVAAEGVNRVRSVLKPRLKHSTGHYLSRLQTDRRSSGGSLITDGGIVYGPWLEGVSSRNQRTRFKGYHHFRLAKQRLQAEAGDIAERVLPRHVDRLNGG